MTLRALIFDVDGTLAETEELHRRAFNETFAEAGLTWHWTRDDYSELLKTTGGKERMRVHRDRTGHDVPDDATIAALHGAKTARYAALMESGEIALRPGVKDLVAEARARGLDIAVATTTSRPNVEALTRACWDRLAEEVFDVIASGDDVPHKKPAGDVYHLALAGLGLTAGQVIALEDSRNGVLSARAAGISVVVTPSAYTSDEDFAGAACVLPRLPDLDTLMSLVGSEIGQVVASFGETV